MDTIPEIWLADIGAIAIPSHSKVAIVRWLPNLFLSTDYCFVRYSILISFILIACQASAQSTSLIRLTGKVVDETNTPMAFVNLSVVADRSLGTYSNSAGEFDFQLPGNLSNDSIIFSNIGYENSVVAIQDLLSAKVTQSIRLKPRVYILQEIVVKPDSALAIIRESIKRLPNTLANEKNILQGFFREIIRSDHTYDRLVEAAVDVFDNGYHSIKDNALQFRVREVRKSDDFRDLDWEQSIYNYLRPKSGLHTHFESIFFNDYIRNNSCIYSMLLNAPLNNDELYLDVTLTLDSITNIGPDKIWCIGITHKSDSGSFFPKGTIHIRTRDYAILQMEYEVGLDTEISQLTVPDEPYLHKTLIKYKEYNGKMYVDLLYRKAYRFTTNMAKYDKAKAAGKRDGQFFYELFVTNEIITEKDKVKSFRKKEQYRKNIDLYKADWKYNESFWNTYNSVNERPLLPNIQKDLERESSLNDQYKKNGSDK
jgi:hypothetical protein